MARAMRNIETELRQEERRHRDGFPGMRRDVADLLLRAADTLAKRDAELANVRAEIKRLTEGLEWAMSL